MSTSFYPTQEPGPQATDQALPDYLSYSAVQTNVEPFTVTRTGLVFPDGGQAPFQTVVVSEGVRTQVSYSVVNLPLTYNGPLPPPPLGSGYVLPGSSATQGSGTAGQPGSSESTAATATATSTATATQYQIKQRAI